MPVLRSGRQPCGVLSLSLSKPTKPDTGAAIADAKRNKMTDAYAPVRAAAKERQKEAGGDRRSKGYRGTLPKQFLEAKPKLTIAPRASRETRDIRAKAAGTNAKYIDMADKLLDVPPARHGARATIFAASRLRART
jgi:hypothetical protein